MCFVNPHNTPSKRCYFLCKSAPLAPGLKAVRCHVRMSHAPEAFPGWLAAAPCFTRHPITDLSIKTEGDILWIKNKI